MDEIIGRTLGPYQITQPLGRGGMASVYKAYQPALQRYVAVKVLPAHLAQDPQFSERFTREAHAVAHLDHPNILPVYDFGHTDGITYIVMKYVEGGTLKDMLDRGRVPLPQCAQILSQVAAALDYAHVKGVVHRDIKPANILMARPDWALLSDFGLAKVAEATVKLTGTGVGMGTPEYMSPEQAHSLQTDSRSDIYSLGVTLYAMVTGEVPYTGSTPIAVILKHINDPLPSPRKIIPDLAPAAEAAILSAMAKNPADRPQTAGELSALFNSAIGSRPAVEATRLEIPTAPGGVTGGTVLVEPPPTTPRPGATVLERAPAPPQPAPPRVVTPSPTYTPPPYAPPGAPPAAKRGGAPWLWIAGAIAAVVCLAVVGGLGMLGGIFALGSSTATPQARTFDLPTPVVTTPTAATTVDIVSMPEGTDALYLLTFGIMQQLHSDYTFPGTRQYTAIISSNDQLDIGPAWCSKDAAALEAAWSRLQFSLTVDGKPVDLSAMRVGDYSDGTCRGYYVLARNWSPGQHTLVYTRSQSDRVNDGWCDYNAGDYVEEITLTVLTPEAAAAATQQAPSTLPPGQRVVEDFNSDRGIYTYQGACLAGEEVSGGKLRQFVSTTYYQVYAGLPGTYRDFEMSVEASFTRVDGTGAEYGIHFRRADSNNYYAFYVSEDAQYTFGKYVDGQWTDITPWRTASACLANTGGASAYDLLGLVAQGSQFEFYCNGTLLGTADDSTFSEGQLWLQAGTYDATHVEVTFDNVSVTGR